MTFEDVSIKWARKKILEQQEQAVAGWYEQRNWHVYNSENAKGYQKTAAAKSLKSKFFQLENAPRPYNPDDVEIISVDFEQGGDYQLGEMTWDHESSGYIIKYKIKLSDGKYKRFPTYQRYGAKSSNIGEFKVEADDFTSIVNDLVDVAIESRPNIQRQPSVCTECGQDIK